MLGIAFGAGGKAGILLTVALTLEILFLGLAVATELGETLGALVKAVAVTGADGPSAHRRPAGGRS